MDWKTLRSSMVDKQLRARGLRDENVLRAIEETPRHLFVPGNEQDSAYNDSPLSIGEGQTISQPFIVGYMTELLSVRNFHKVLEIGTGSGYQTAILARLAREVYSIELHAGLQEDALAILHSQGAMNIHFAVGDGHYGWPEAAPFDRIMVTAAATVIPQPLLDQLAVGGRMVIPAGRTPEEQILKVVVKTDAFGIDISDTVPVRFVPLLTPPEESKSE